MAKKATTPAPAKTTTKKVVSVAATKEIPTSGSAPMNQIYSVKARAFVDINEDGSGKIVKTKRGGFMFKGTDANGTKIAGLVSVTKAEWLVENGYATHEEATA